MTTKDDVIDAFKNGYKMSAGNYFTDGHSLFLFGNKIAEHTPNGIRVTNAGWDTSTTNKTLYRIAPNLERKKGVMHMNGVPWNGDWTDI